MQELEPQLLPRRRLFMGCDWRGPGIELGQRRSTVQGLVGNNKPGMVRMIIHGNAGLQQPFLRHLPRTTPQARIFSHN